MTELWTIPQESSEKHPDFQALCACGHMRINHSCLPMPDGGFSRELSACGNCEECHSFTPPLPGLEAKGGN